MKARNKYGPDIVLELITKLDTILDSESCFIIMGTAEGKQFQIMDLYHNIKGSMVARAITKSLNSANESDLLEDEGDDPKIVVVDKRIQ